MTTQDKRKFVESLADEAEEAASGRQNLKTLYIQNQQMLQNGFKNSGVSVKDRDDNVLLKEEDKLASWKEHFESILKRPRPKQVTEVLPVVEYLDICIQPPTMEEV